MSWCLVGSEMCIRDRFGPLSELEHHGQPGRLVDSIIKFIGHSD
jgi:hypothetical protein